MDLAELDTRKGAEEGFELQLHRPQDGQPVPIWITVMGADSESYQNAMHTLQRRRADKFTRNKKFVVTPEDVEEDALELLACATSTWRAEVTLDGKPFPAFSKAAARDLYRRFRWIREQVDAAMGDRANFLPRSVTP